MTLKEYSGAAIQVRLSGTLTAGELGSFTVNQSVNGFPTGSTAPFVVTIDRGTASEEKILVATRTGAVFNGLTRGYDGTAAVQHSDQAVVEHTIDAVSLTEMIQHANNVPADPHPQYQVESQVDDLIAASPYTIPHTWAVGADVRVPSGDTDYIPPFFVPVPAGYQVTIKSARHRINSGTSATVKLQKDGVDVTGYVALSVTTTSTTTDGADSTFTDGQALALVVTAVAGTPRNMTFTVYLEYKKLAS